MSILNNKNIQIIADAAFDSENYELAYKYYNQLLEVNLEHPENWLKKGYCAAQLSTLDKMLDKEALLALKTSIKLTTYNEAEIENIANQYATIFFTKIVEGTKFIQNEIDRNFNAIQIPSFTLYAVHNLRKTTIQIEVWNKYSEKLFQYFKIMDIVVRMKPNAITCEKVYRSINYTNIVSKHTGDHFYKIDGNSIESQFLSELLNFTRSELNNLLPDNEVTNPKSTSGCFIATATMGNYEHPLVLELREFRDNWLIKKVWGENFINWYYKNSPKVANRIKDSNTLKKLCYIFIIKPAIIFSRFLK